MNKDQFIEEMLSEVKNLKDLTKEQLPLIAQEFVRYRIIFHTTWFILTLLIFIVGLGLGLYALFHVFPDTYSGEQNQFGIGMIATILSLLGGTGALTNLLEILNFKFQPRRMAIKAITSLKSDLE